MPAPLLWLGAAALGLYASDRANTAYLKRKDIVAKMPGESRHRVTPQNGSVVCCGIYGVLDHSGIWVNGNIYELNGNGLVRCVSPTRFLQNRSGNSIYVAHDEYYRAFASEKAAERAQHQLYQLYDYHLIRQNCHRFVAQMLSGREVDITSFSELNEFLKEENQVPISWSKIA